MNEIAEWVKIEFENRKAKNPHFSLRAFSRWLDISPAQVSQIISGKRPITVKTLNRLSERLNIDPIEQKGLFQKLNPKHNSEKPSFRNLEEDQFKLISDWYHLAILSLTRVKNARSDPRWVAQRLGIAVQTANEAIVRLVRLGILEIAPKFKQVGDPFEISSQVPSRAIQKYHVQSLNLAIEKLETLEPEHREIQSLCFPMNPKKMAAVRKLINFFLEDALKVAAASPTEEDEVYNLNVQLVPLTNKIKTKG